MIKGDFYGNSFIWFTGQVENRFDPLKLGCVQIRIFGLHPFTTDGRPDTSKLPTKDLPWAQVAIPSTGTTTFGGPREGDWVFGFFQDGPNAQVPVIVSTYGGVESKESIVVNENTPVPPNGVVTRVAGEPVNSRISRGVVDGTIVNVTNQQRSHVCDISNLLKTEVSIIKVAFGTILEAIRKAIQALLAALGFDPSGAIRKTVDMVKEVNAKIQKVRQFLEDLQAYKQIFIDFVRKVRAMIDYILTLPAKILKFVRECLAEFFASLSTFMGDLVGGIQQDFNSNTAELVAESKLLFDNVMTVTAQITDLATTPAQALDTFLTPATKEEVAQASADFETDTGYNLDQVGNNIITSISDSIGTVTNVATNGYSTTASGGSTISVPTTTLSTLFSKNASISTIETTSQIFKNAISSTYPTSQQMANNTSFASNKNPGP